MSCGAKEESMQHQHANKHTLAHTLVAHSCADYISNGVSVWVLLHNLYLTTVQIISSLTHGIIALQLYFISPYSKKNIYHSEILI